MHFNYIGISLMHFSSLNFAPVIKTLLLKNVLYFVIQCSSTMDILINCEGYLATSFF